MTGIIRNLFGDYCIYDTPDYEDFVPKLLFVEKWTLYFSGSISMFDVMFSRNAPRGFLQVSSRILKYVAPCALASGTFVTVLYASAHLRGKKDDEWNSFNATVLSGAAFCTLRRTPQAYVMYLLMVGFYSNIYKQIKINNWLTWDNEKLAKARAPAYLSGPYLVDWHIGKDYPPKWINGDELEKVEKGKK